MSSFQHASPPLNDFSWEADDSALTSLDDFSYDDKQQPVAAIASPPFNNFSYEGDDSVLTTDNDLPCSCDIPTLQTIENAVRQWQKEWESESAWNEVFDNELGHARIEGEHTTITFLDNEGEGEDGQNGPPGMGTARTPLSCMAAKNLTPASSKRKKRQPYTIAFITSLLQKLDLDVPIDAAVGSCLTTAFYSIARAGEFTIPNLSSFDPATHVKRSDIRLEKDRNGLDTTVFHLPRTKTSHTGEDVFWARQQGPTDPEAALKNHFRVNNPPLQGALFSYKHGNSHRPLTKTKFISCLSQAAKDAGLNPLQGHAIRIGATLEYLL
ncbi:hypothetical protein EV424DRAFT_1540178 [Suillus variegatus]|nr:hypothetical protein EV424DRAFT_1540178 [Suillus variegatus]